MEFFLADRPDTFRSANPTILSQGNLIKLLRCPDHPGEGHLRPLAGGFRCEVCGRTFADRGGFFQFLPLRFGPLGEFQERERRQWDAQAKKYEKGRLQDEIYMACVKAVAGALIPQPGELILDAGCGTGLVLRHFWQRGLRVVALDLSGASLRRCRSSFPHEDILHVQGDLSYLPFPEGIFDRVLCANALHHIPSGNLRRRCIGELARVTRPGGRVVISVQNFSLPKRQAGWKKEDDRASGPSGKIQYIFRFLPGEFRDLLAFDLQVRALTGVGMPLWYFWKLSPLSRLLEKLVRNLPISTTYGHQLVAVCQRPFPQKQERVVPILYSLGSGPGRSH